MKKLLFVIALLGATRWSYAQTFDEWFKQKKTQIQYLLDQILALKTYTNYLEKGYDIVQKGSAIISDIKKGDFSLHNGYFNSLKSINPAIASYSRIPAIIADQASIIKTFRIFISKSPQLASQLSGDDLKYINQVYSNLIADCEEVVNELIFVTTKNEAQMTDEERIKKIDSIYYDMRDKATFAKSFINEASLLAANRMIEQSQVDNSKKIYGF